MTKRFFLSFFLALSLLFPTGACAKASGPSFGLPPCSNNGYVLTYNTSTGQYYCAANPAGGVTGPVSSTDRGIAIWNGTTGAAIQNSTVTINSSNQLLTPNGSTNAVNIAATTATTTGLALQPSVGVVGLVSGGILRSTLADYWDYKVSNGETGFYINGARALTLFNGAANRGVLLTHTSFGGSIASLAFSSDNTWNIGYGLTASPNADVRPKNMAVGTSICIACTGAAPTSKGLYLSSTDSGMHQKEGTNARAGVATLVGGTVTVSTTQVLTGDRILCARQVAGGTVGNLECANTITNATSFVINSSSALDTSTVYWQIIRPL